MMFIVIELQSDADGKVSNIVNAYAERNDAEARYHQILMAGAKSTLPCHSAVMLDERGNLEKSEYYLH